jgi:hypothetical protein
VTALRIASQNSAVLTLCCAKICPIMRSYSGSSPGSRSHSTFRVQQYSTPCSSLYTSDTYRNVPSALLRSTFLTSACNSAPYLFTIAKFCTLKLMNTATALNTWSALTLRLTLMLAASGCRYCLISGRLRLVNSYLILNRRAKLSSVIIRRRVDRPVVHSSRALIRRYVVSSVGSLRISDSISRNV